MNKQHFVNVSGGKDSNQTGNGCTSDLGLCEMEQAA